MPPGQPGGALALGVVGDGVTDIHHHCWDSAGENFGILACRLQLHCGEPTVTAAPAAERSAMTQGGATFLLWADLSPEDLARLVNLETLQVADNRLVGPVPEAVCGLSQLWPGWEKGDVFSPFSRLLISSHVLTQFPLISWDERSSLVEFSKSGHFL